ncbi:hypothetical protein [Desulfurococcus mucosus]|uniref:Uncharacterized protein n=1 Tax=Desulfurococcus mucosus (strain ATCC 35584 / DSM 2162 / JCM 9187 / O7/1) TaxID=765177 RepID=E8R9G8_DESM0|nr:hypothetical protein [Desulfurococcus mucosus]ADV65144.1 hypothetical protein Desmu_0840 [Desulfurococcus mucosus DSM 2162]
MSASISSYRGSIFSRLLGAFKPKDPLVKNIEESIVLMERMIRSIEASKKGLEMTLEEHTRKVKSSGAQDKEIQRIIDEESRNISGYIALFTKVLYDLTRVKLRLETITQIQEPMKALPEVLDELKRIEPEVEKINPQLVSLIRAIEQKVGSIQVSTDSSSAPYPLVSKHIAQGEGKPPVKRVEEHSAPGSRLGSPGLAEKIPPPPPSDPVELKTAPIEPGVSPVAQGVNVDASSDIPLNVIEQWLLAELRGNGGILDIPHFTAKYRVARDKVYEALRRLEEKGLIKLKRF